jgi:hypothetical protein
MTRIKLLAISTLTAAMIAGSALVVATPLAGDSPAQASADVPSIATDLAADPIKRGGGGTGRALKR